LSTESDEGFAEALEKKVGPKGSHLSGGQKQRAAIARAILRHPSVLLLDEATSALDPENETKVEESLERLMSGKTTLNITHRLDKLKEKNKICVIEQGMVVEEGSYNELMKKEGKFHEMQSLRISNT
jgi:ABC-type multidrug transport system fused ATPase/permease subunit